MGDWENNKDIQLMRLHTTQDDEVLIIAFNVNPKKKIIAFNE